MAVVLLIGWCGGLPVRAADTDTAAATPQKATALGAVKVQAVTVDTYTAQNASSGALGDRPLLDTPFSIDAVTQELIENRQANNLVDVYKGDASATPISSGYTSETSSISVRGLQLDTLNGYHINGLTVPVWGSDLPIESFQQIELLKGLGGFMYGFGQPGGMLNFVTKKPTDETTERFRVGYSSRGTYTKEADLGGRFGERKQFGYRLDAVDEDGDNYVKGSHVKRDSLSLGLDWRIVDNLVWHFDSLYQRRKVTGTPYGIIPCQDFSACANPSDFVSIPAALKGSQRVASTDTSYSTTVKFASTGVAWQISPDWHLNVDYGWSWQSRTNRDSAIFLLDDSGSYNENQYLGYDTWTYSTAQAVLAGKFTTGPIGHEIAVGTSWLQQTTRYDDPQPSQLSLGDGNLGDPGNFAVPQTGIDHHVRNEQVITQRSLFASDTLSFGEHWQALLGLRSIDYTQNGYDYLGNGAVNAHYHKSPVTPTYALMYKPVEAATIYASYVKSLEAGSSVPQGLGYANEGQVFGPLTSKQYELGAKWQQGSWNYGAAAFRIERGLDYGQAVGDQIYYVQNGQTRFDGIELSAKGQLGSDWTLLGSLMWLDAKNVRADPAVDGKRAYGDPRAQASVYLEYAVPTLPGLVFSAGGQYVGNRPLEADNSNIAKAYHTFDLGARYSTHIGHTPVIYRINLDNVTNERYWLTAWEAILNQGPPRVLRASVEFTL